MSRITIKNLNNDVRLLNEIAKRPETPYSGRDENGHLIANKGHFMISSAYGGYSLHEMAAGGGVNDVFYCGHVPAKQLHGLIHAYIKGFDTAKNS